MNDGIELSEKAFLFPPPPSSYSHTFLHPPPSFLLSSGSVLCNSHIICILCTIFSDGLSWCAWNGWKSGSSSRGIEMRSDKAVPSRVAKDQVQHTKRRVSVWGHENAAAGEKVGVKWLMTRSYAAYMQLSLLSILSSLLTFTFRLFLLSFPCSSKFTEEIDTVWNFETSVKQYAALGGTSKQSVERQTQKLRKWLEEWMEQEKKAGTHSDGDGWHGRIEKRRRSGRVINANKCILSSPFSLFVAPLATWFSYSLSSCVFVSFHSIEKMRGFPEGKKEISLCFK